MGPSLIYRQNVRSVSLIVRPRRVKAPEVRASALAAAWRRDTTRDDRVDRVGDFVDAELAARPTPVGDRVDHAEDEVRVQLAGDVVADLAGFDAAADEAVDRPVELAPA